jgi:NADH:ubiquinone oxidoreductase subunit K
MVCELLKTEGGLQGARGHLFFIGTMGVNLVERSILFRCSRMLFSTSVVFNASTLGIVLSNVLEGA